MSHRYTSMPHRCHIDATSIHIDATWSHIDATSILSFSLSFFALLDPLEGRLWSCFLFPLSLLLLILLFHFLFILGPLGTSWAIFGPVFLLLYLWSMECSSSFPFSYWALHRSTSISHRCHIDATLMPHRCDIDATSMQLRSTSMPHRCDIDATSMQLRSTSMLH